VVHSHLFCLDALCVLWVRSARRQSGAWLHERRDLSRKCLEGVPEVSPKRFCPQNEENHQAGTTMTNVLDTLKVPLAIGTLQWGTTPIDHKIINPRGVISEAQAQQIVQEFTKAGVQVWDTAEGYGGGTSEKRLSRCLKDSNDAIFMTKFLPVPWRGFWESDFENAVRQSCLRLGVKTIPLYLLHAPMRKQVRRRARMYLRLRSTLESKRRSNPMNVTNMNITRELKSNLCFRVCHEADTKMIPSVRSCLLQQKWFGTSR